MSRLDCAMSVPTSATSRAACLPSAVISRKLSPAFLHDLYTEYAQLLAL